MLFRSEIRAGRAVPFPNATFTVFSVRTLVLVPPPGFYSTSHTQSQDPSISPPELPASSKYLPSPFFSTVVVVVILAPN
jgi:hypothetical protein